MTHVCMATGYTQNMKSFASLAEKTIRHYADAFNYDFVFCDTPRAEKPPQWMKISIILKNIQNYNYVSGSTPMRS